MNPQQQINIRTSGQVDPKLSGTKNKSGTAAPLMINGCTVSFTSTRKGTDETIKMVKQILFSAYRTKAAKG